MASHKILHNFYTSRDWEQFRYNLMMQRMTDKGIICEHCRKVIIKASDIILHHKHELTPENVDDRTISLNPANVMIVHHECHNRIHKRFGNVGDRKAYIVYGAPLSGKTSYVKEHIQRGDMVVNLDKLYEAVSFLPYYDKPSNLLHNVFVLQNALIDNIKTRYGKWNNAFIIGGYADKFKREQLANDLSAELIFCNTSKEICLSRLELDEDRQYRKDEWQGYISKWFDEYVV